jgi:hypothetical protein
MIIFALGGVWISVWLGYIWTENVISGLTFKEYFGINLLAVTLWIPSLIVFLILGAVFTKLTKVTNKYYWPLGLGVLASAYWFSMRKVIFIEKPSILDLTWGYSEVFIPIIASLLGWWVYRRASKSLQPTAQSGG